MQVHIVYLPLVFFLGMTYEHWRRRRLAKRRMATVVDAVRQSIETRKTLMQVGEKDPPASQF